MKMGRHPVVIDLTKDDDSEEPIDVCSDNENPSESGGAKNGADIDFNAQNCVQSDNLHEISLVGLYVYITEGRFNRQFAMVNANAGGNQFKLAIPSKGQGAETQSNESGHINNVAHGGESSRSSGDGGERPSVSQFVEVVHNRASFVVIGDASAINALNSDPELMRRFVLNASSTEGRTNSHGNGSDSNDSDTSGGDSEDGGEDDDDDDDCGVSDTATDTAAGDASRHAFAVNQPQYEQLMQSSSIGADGEGRGEGKEESKGESEVESKGEALPGLARVHREHAPTVTADTPTRDSIPYSAMHYAIDDSGAAISSGGGDSAASVVGTPMPRVRSSQGSGCSTPGTGGLPKRLKQNKRPSTRYAGSGDGAARAAAAGDSGDDEDNGDDGDNSLLQSTAKTALDRIVGASSSAATMRSSAETPATVDAHADDDNDEGDALDEPR